MTVNKKPSPDALAAVHLLAESGLKPAAVELTVVSDEFDCLGTLDLLAWTPTGDLVVVDHKTAGDPTGWKWRHLEYAVQMGVYAAGQPLVERDGEIVRATWEAVGLVPPNQDVGLRRPYPRPPRCGEVAAGRSGRREATRPTCHRHP